MAESQNAIPLLITRTAINESGYVGWLYDACLDRVIEKLDVTFEEPRIRIHEKVKCVIKSGDTNPSQNPLELIDFDEQLRLSLLLNLTPTTGIATFIDYPDRINQYTRVFHYLYMYREYELADDLHKVQEWLETTLPETDATHIITGVSWGVDIVVILQLPSENHIAKMIDDMLEKYRAYLNEDCDHLKVTRDDLHLCTQLIDLKVYSNIPDLTVFTKLHDIFHNIHRFKTNDTMHQRLSYTLYPIQSLCSSNITSNYNFVPLYSTNNSEFEQYLFEISHSMKTMEICFNENIPNLLCGHFKRWFSDLYKQWSDVKIMYATETEQFFDLVVEIRSDQTEIDNLDEKFASSKQTDIKNDIFKLTENVINLNRKGHLITDLGKKRFAYCNVDKQGVDGNDTEQTLQRKLIIDDQTDRMLCSTDRLNEDDSAQFEGLCHELIEELEKNPKLRLFYADFTYSTFDLGTMMILPSNKHYVKKKKPYSKEISSSTEILRSPSFASESNTSTTMSRKVRIIPPLSSSAVTTETINILLLGETGVGKSTFINAFTNYLIYNTLQQAQSNKPNVIIPVSFLVTVGDNFEEHMVKFGDVDGLNSENFDHPGQSVTQNCKSYKFYPKHCHGKRVRIIDTPGFGDTRGLDQDDLNMQQILDCIKNLTHLNAVCFLLKPNESRLNIFFRSCLTQLLDLLGPDARNNIIFCFTNARSTFYTPGNTAPLLKTMLGSFPIDDIPFKKANTFCFDNESFRYLVALQNKITFSEHEKEEYEMSWSNSVSEANRLIRYVRKKLTAYLIPNECEAIRSAQLEIVHMVNRMIGVMKDILRNIIIKKINSLKVSKEPHRQDVPLHAIRSNGHNGEYLPSQPIPIDYLRDYKIMNSPLSYQQDDMINQLSIIFHASVQFAHFLVHIAKYRQGDPFLPGLRRLSTEEHANCNSQKQNPLNLQLVEGLKKLIDNYEHRMTVAKLNSERIKSSDIYEWIKYMRKYLSVSEHEIGSDRANVRNDIETTSI